MTEIRIRNERPEDLATIHALTATAFEGRVYSDGSEPRIVDQLRCDGDLALSLVAADSRRIVGHIAFSPVTISDGTEGWYGLGPVSVWPELQRQGIGSALIRKGLANLQTMGTKGVVLLGSTEYYPRFGFEHDPKLVYPGPPAEKFQRLVLSGPAPEGTVSYAPAFG
ncbi:GNAT family N-acetyltransferase [Paraurantiacibacter namhicola]|uniref:N-acetyltransferase domain-containing protein n=1 Tax=Paraurantiacibacter namhicola TaxID=645517 RepID=A0A1C7D6L1_9SPHN|nr:N-acetyltransferase [Paraurantiacibacter namhicola]ANU06943.1 hypothetical protein A6F65_00621 [Paraurantiacibacter namhicola]